MADERKLKSCDDFPGPCCDSCHEDDALGYHNLPEVETADRKLFAIVCCLKLDEAKKAAEAADAATT